MEQDLLQDNRELREIIGKLTREKKELLDILHEIKFLAEHIEHGESTP